MTARLVAGLFCLHVWGGGLMFVLDYIEVCVLGGTGEGLQRRERLVFTKFTHPQSLQYKYSINSRIALEVDQPADRATGFAYL